jgi:hypothetical protein
MTKQQGFLATFRIDEKLWGKFKDIAKNNQTNASALILGYIQAVVSSGDVDNVPKATPPNIDISPQPNLDSIYKYIDDKLDNLENISIQDIDNRINESLADGDIGGAIANSYKAAMGQFGGLLEELQALQKQVEELQSNPPAAVPSPQSPIPNYQSPITNDELVEILGIGDVIAGQIYNFDSLKEDGIIDAIKENQALIENFIGDKLTLKNDLSDMNKILKFMCFQPERTTKDNKKYNRVKVPK